MNKQPPSAFQPSDPASGADAGLHPDPAVTMAEIAERSQRIVQEFIARQSEEGEFVSFDPLHIGTAFFEMAAKLIAEPAKLINAQLLLWQDYLTLWQNTTRRIMGEESDPLIVPSKDDRRFQDAAWKENEIFDFIKQSYLLSARWIQGLIHEVDGLDDKTARKVDFYTRQFIDALAPSNFVMTNPEVLRTTVETGGENLVKGLKNLLDDLERGKGKLNIRMTDLEAFRLGENIAVTPGKVIHQTDLAQLLQYQPATATVHKRPLLIVPPWINKFYILDLRQSNSFIRWATEQGHTVFVLSWANPDERLAAKTFEDYMKEGILDALDAIERAVGEREVNAVGYCLGGTLLASTMAAMAAKGEERIKSATFFATMVDFTESGELSVFIDEDQLSMLEERMQRKGYLEGSEMATTFNMLRANDLIWSFVINNYLLGKDPFPFDLLYWNSDATRMPAAMHSFYLRKMYQENLLSRPGGISLNGVPIDLGKIRQPVYIQASKEDHIAPWKSAYAATQLYGGPVRFVLAASGHIAGVINPPAAHKYCHWINSRRPKNPESWLAGAAQEPGSWWPDWAKWITKHAGPQVPARIPGAGGLPALEDAPGSYVRVRES